METEVAGIKLQSYILNASGPKDSNLEELEIMQKKGYSSVQEVKGKSKIL